MAAHGQLPAVKVGDRWLVERSAVERRRSQGAVAGRPFAPHNAWALLLLASGEEAEGLDSSLRSRLRRALKLEGLEKLGPRLGGRAEANSFSAHPGEIGYLMDDPDLIRSGISAAGAHGLDLVSGQEADGYLRKSRLKEFVANHALVPAESNGNVRLRLVPDQAWRFPPGASLAPIAAVALDLAEDPDPRSAEAGRAALAELDSAHSRLRDRQPAGTRA